MRPQRRLPLLIALAAGVAMAAGPAWAGSGFSDMGGSHWAYPYVAALDEESVVDAYRVWLRYRFGWRQERHFLPERAIRRDAWFTWLARLLDLPVQQAHQGIFSDVGPGHRLEGDEPAAPWLEAAGRAGLASPPRLDPTGTLPRQVAVAGLMAALGLESYARSLPAADVERLLARFSDRHALARDLRPVVAAAVRLNIVEGYPDGTLRPERSLTRAEAAAVLARSALVRPAASPNPFSPDGDGRDEVTHVRLDTLRQRGLVGWSATVYHPNGTAVWDTGSRPGSPPRGGTAFTWNGRDFGGLRLPAGTYYLRAQVLDARGQRWQSALVPVQLILHSLRAWADPGVAAPGALVTISALTEGPAQTVTVRGPGSAAGEILLRPDGPSGSGQQLWSARLVLPEDSPEGEARYTVTARFPGTTRQQSVTVLVRWPLQLTGWLEPDPVPAGTLLRVYARTAPMAARVVARFADGFEAPLEASGGGWRLQRRIPAGSPAGPSWVDLQAWWDGRSRVVRVPFRIGPSPLGRVRITLTE